MKLEAHEQPLVFVKDVLSGTVHADAVSLWIPKIHATLGR